MSDPTHTVVIIKASQLADPETFEQLRVNSQIGTFDELAATTELIDGETLQDRAIEEALEQDTSEAALAEAKRRAHKLAGEAAVTLYDVKVSLVDGSVSGIQKRTILPQDKEATKKQQRMAARVGYGPKTNDSSFVNRRAVPRR